MRDRVDAHAAAFPTNVASHLRLVQEQGRDVAYGRWVLGQNYRAKAGYYGEYPPGYLARVMALFPDAGADVLHAFAGALPAGPYVRLDVNPALGPELVGSVYAARALVDAACGVGHTFALVAADPPYTATDAERYGTPMVHRRRVLAALATVTAPGGHLAWLDTVWPMHSKREWVTVGRIAITRSTNHRCRDLTLFERVA